MLLSELVVALELVVTGLVRFSCTSPCSIGVAACEFLLGSEDPFIT